MTLLPKTGAGGEDQADADAGLLVLSSPLTLLLAEEQHGDRDAVELLLLTYTGDFGFFEKFGLGLAQAAGARVTIVADAAMATVDPRAARRAGRAYLPGLASCAGAFHPKFLLIAGEKRVTAAIGSGNMTMAGWQANAELWTVLNGTPGNCPPALGDLARFLRLLPDQVSLSRNVPEALHRSAGLLDAMLATAPPPTPAAENVRIVSSAFGPIIDQLPRGPVDELCASAPFHDPGAVALSAVINRLNPVKVTVAHQPGMTQLDGDALGQLLAGIGRRLLIDSERRYRHGKLLEWVADGQRMCLTGSANLSGSALLKPMSHDGNCELGIISPIGPTLLPAGTEQDLTDPMFARQRMVITPRRPSGPLLLGATRVEQGLHVLAVRPARSAARIDVSPAESPPEMWEAAGTLQAGQSEVTITFAAVAGSRVRLVSPAPAHQVAKAPAGAPAADSTWVPEVSNTVFVVDPARVFARPGGPASRTPPPTPINLFGDPRLAEKFFADMAVLAADVVKTPTVAATKSSTAADVDGPVHAGGDNEHAWQHYLDVCAGRVGVPLLRFALGLPPLPSAELFSNVLPTVSWAEEIVADAESGLPGDTAENPAGTDDLTDATATLPEDGNGATTVRVPDLRGTPLAVRARYQRWAARLVDAAPQLSAPERMLVCRLVLWAAAAGAWEHDDRSWVPLLSRAVAALPGGDLPQPLEPQIGSLAAVALSVLRSHTSRLERDQGALAFERATAAAGYLVLASEPVFVEEYTSALAGSFGAAAAPAAVAALVSDILTADPVKDAMWALVAAGRDEVHRHGQRMLHVPASGGNPVIAAITVVAAAQDAAAGGLPVGAWAGQASDAKWAVCVWQPPNLYTVEHSRGQLLWRHYRCQGSVSPRTLAASRSLEAAKPVPHGPFLRPVSETVAVLASLGHDKPSPPADCG